MQATDLTPRGLELEVCLHGPSPPEERGGLKRGLHSNCWGEVRRIATHVVALLEITCRSQPPLGKGRMGAEDGIVELYSMKTPLPQRLPYNNPYSIYLVI